jgi:23S rRNA pseudouridine2605 synthase
MEFFAKMPERLYPVGRLDYQSEGLLLVTNDGELANKLTKAASGVEKTYLVKVSGQPTEDELEVLRGGVSIERGKPGTGRVKTAPARIRQVRQGDNPWYEVILIEGRNRELRKMFEEIGHFVEKIRRTGYGPLVLDQEPGNFRELDANELELLRKAADGKYRTPKSKDVRRRNAMDAGLLPTVLPRPSNRPRIAPEGQAEAGAGQAPPRKPYGEPGGAKPYAKPYGKPDTRGGEREKPYRPNRPEGGEFRPAPRTGAAPERFGAGRPAAGNFGARTGGGGSSYGAAKPGAGRPAWKKDDRPARPPQAASAEGEDRRSSYRPASGSGPRPFGAGRPSGPRRDFSQTGSTGTDRAGSERSGSDRPATGSAGRGRTGGGRSFGAKPAWNKPGGDRPSYQRPSAPRREPEMDEPMAIRDPNEKRVSKLRIEPIEQVERTETRGARPPRANTAPPRFDRGATDRPRSDRPRTDRPTSSRPSFGRTGGGERPASARPYGDKPKFDKPAYGKPSSAGRSYDKPRFDKPGFDKPRSAKPSFDKPRYDKPKSDRPSFDTAGSSKPRFERPKFGGARPGGSRPSTGRPAGSTRPPRGDSGLSRPFTTSSGKPRAGGARPSSKPGKPGGKFGGKSKPRGRK